LNKKNITRRQLGAIAAASLATKTFAQTQSAPAPDYFQAALESHKENSAILGQFKIGMSVEPAFQFKA
jgi:hypothetical protein